MILAKSSAGIVLAFMGVVVSVSVQAQFNCTTNGATITITRYTDPGGAVAVPSTIKGLPVTASRCFVLAFAI